MNDFCDFLKQNGISDPQGLASFLNEFNENPEMFYSLSDGERKALGRKMDKAFDAIFSGLGRQEINQ